jgi:hypothetical protein
MTITLAQQAFWEPFEEESENLYLFQSDAFDYEWSSASDEWHRAPDPAAFWEEGSWKLDG